MTLPKHLRPRWRYLAIEIENSPAISLTQNEFRDALQQSVRSLFGDLGDARLEVRVMSFSHTNGYGTAIVRTHRETVTEARAAVACISAETIPTLGIRISGISGTVRACEEKYLGQETESLTENTVVYDGAERPAVIRGNDLEIQVGDAFIGATRLDIE